MSSRLETYQYLEGGEISRDTAKSVANRHAVNRRAQKHEERTRRRKLRRSSRQVFTLISAQGVEVYDSSGSIVESQDQNDPNVSEERSLSDALAQERQGSLKKRATDYLRDKRSTLIKEFKVALEPQS